MRTEGSEMRTRNGIIFVFGVLLFLAGYFLGTEFDTSSDVILEVSSREDLKVITTSLYEEMLRANVTLTNNEIDLLVAPDRQADVYSMPANEKYPNWDGNESSASCSRGYGEGNTWMHYDITCDNGTRIYEKYTLEGKLLKYFLVNDEPEKTITIIIKE